MSGIAVPSGGICTRGSRERMRSGSTLTADWPGTTTRVADALPWGRKRLATSIIERRTSATLATELAADCASTTATGTVAPVADGAAWQCPQLPWR